MDRKTEAKLAVGALSFFIIVLVLAFTTPNNQQDTPKENSYVEKCKPYFLNSVKCPLDKNQTSSKQSQIQTNRSNGSVETSG